MYYFNSLNMYTPAIYDPNPLLYKDKNKLLCYMYLHIYMALLILNAHSNWQKISNDLNNIFYKLSI